MKRLLIQIITILAFTAPVWAFPPSPPSSGGSPAGASGSVQCNNAGAFGACSNVTDAAIPTPASLHVDDVWTSLGLSEGSQHLGAFSGTTIADNQTVKAAIQALETAVEGKAAVNADTTGSAGSLKSNATTGVMQVVGPAAGSTRVMTTPDADFTPTYKSGAYTDEHVAIFDGTAGGIKDGGVKVTYTGEKLATFAWDGGASAVTTGATTKRCTILPFAATVTKVFAIADASTTTHIHVYQDAFATGSRSTTVTGAVDIGATLGSTDTTLTSWDTSITAEDEICMSVEANDNAKWIHVIVFGTR